MNREKNNIKLITYFHTMNCCSILSYRGHHYFEFQFLIDTIPSTSTVYETLLASGGQTIVRMLTAEMLT